jgi:hypothetical protein
MFRLGRRVLGRDELHVLGEKVAVIKVERAQG